MNQSYHEILSLMNEYCYRIDAGNIEGFAELFEHGTWHVMGDPKGGDTGSEEIIKTLQCVILYDGKPNTKHVMSNVQIDIDKSEVRATAQCYITVFQAVTPDFPLQAIFSGHYHDTFEKVNGVWRFLLREISPDLIGDLSRHRADMS